jgi:hypothetical protein
VDTTHSKRPLKWRIFGGLLAGVFALTALAGWAFSSPVGSSPDDNFHIASIWCGAGDRDHICESTGDSSTRAVPTAVYESPNCFSYKAEVSASCQDVDIAASGGAMSIVSDSNTTDHLYPPVFYSVVSLFVSQDPQTSVLLIRTFNSLLAVTMIGALALLLPRELRQLPVWAITATVVPLGMFFIASSNPSSWAIIGAAVLFYALLGYMRTGGWRKIALGVLALLATVIGAGARADMAIYSVIAVGAVFIVEFSRRNLRVSNLIAPVASVIISAVCFLSANQVGLAAGGLDGGADPTLTTATLIFRNLVMMPLLWLGAFGTSGLGWLDTKMPETVWISGLLAFVLLIIFGLRRLERKTLIAAAGVLAALWLIPTYILVKSHAVVGVLVQSRYLLPLLILLAGIMIYRRNGPTGRVPRFLAWAAIGLLSVANALALHRNLKRYITGVDGTGIDLNANIEWWWNIPLSPMAVWIIASISFAAYLVLLLQLTPRFGYGLGFGSSEGPRPSPRPLSKKLATTKS